MNLLPLLFNRYTALLTLVVAAAWGAYAYRGALIQQGYDKAMTEVAEAQADLLREFVKERTRQQNIIKEIQDAYVTQSKNVEAFRARLRAADGKLRDQKRDFETRLAAASADSLRRYAQASDDNLERCIRHVERFAVEAASCSGTAHALKQNLDALGAGAPAP
jgi:hypothetical protein